MNNKITIKNILRHLHTVNKHRFKVFCLCCKVGIPIQGLLHDLSKYSPTEFWKSVKYYQGTRSPIKKCKEENVIVKLAFIIKEEISIIMNIGMIIMLQQKHLLYHSNIS